MSYFTALFYSWDTLTESLLFLTITLPSFLIFTINNLFVAIFMVVVVVSDVFIGLDLNLLEPSFTNKLN